MKENKNLKVYKRKCQGKSENGTDWAQIVCDLAYDLRKAGFDLEVTIYNDDFDYNEEIVLTPLQTAMIFITLGLKISYTENVESDLPTIKMYTDEGLKKIIEAKKNPFHIAT